MRKIRGTFAAYKRAHSLKQRGNPLFPRSPHSTPLILSRLNTAGPARKKTCTASQYSVYAPPAAGFPTYGPLWPVSNYKQKMPLALLRTAFAGYHPRIIQRIACYIDTLVVLFAGKQEVRSGTCFYCRRLVMPRACPSSRRVGLSLLAAGCSPAAQAPRSQPVA